MGVELAITAELPGREQVVSLRLEAAEHLLDAIEGAGEPGAEVERVLYPLLHPVVADGVSTIERHPKQAVGSALALIEALLRRHGPTWEAGEAWQERVRSTAGELLGVFERARARVEALPEGTTFTVCVF